ncbi:MAG: ankyrin repeat domain-containing protein [Cyanobacteria bacterium P01_G01_bin.54]
MSVYPELTLISIMNRDRPSPPCPHLGFPLFLIIPLALWGCTASNSTPTQPSPALDSAPQTATPSPDPLGVKLIEATKANDLATVQQLLSQGVDPNTVVHTNTALIYAARDGHLAIAQRLIDHGADVNWIDGEGVTPIILSAFKGHVELTRLLLAQDADITVRDQWNRTALDYALRRGEDDEIVRLLREGDRSQ